MKSKRNNEYKRAISKLIIQCAKLLQKEYKIIIIDNSSQKKSFLDNFQVDVFRTDNNLLQTQNKGIKELTDVHDCIHAYSMKDDDFIVKITGRQLLKDSSPFLASLNREHDYDAIIRQGSYQFKATEQCEDCVTGLIGMRVKQVKQIQIPTEYVAVEWNWAKATYKMDASRILSLENLGLEMNDTYNAAL